MINNQLDGSGERLRKIRKSLGLTQNELATILKTSHGHISGMEKDKKNITDSTIDLLFLKCNVNENFIRNNQGEMFNSAPIEDEIASAVSDLLEDDNPFFNIIVDIMSIYRQLDPKSKEVIHNVSGQLVNKIKKRKESD